MERRDLSVSPISIGNLTNGSISRDPSWHCGLKMTSKVVGLFLGRRRARPMSFMTCLRTFVRIAAAFASLGSETLMNSSLFVAMGVTVLENFGRSWTSVKGKQGEVWKVGLYMRIVSPHTRSPHSYIWLTNGASTPDPLDEAATMIDNEMELRPPALKSQSSIRRIQGSLD